MNFTAPNVDTHVPVMTQLPDEPAETDIDRPDLDVPSLWQRSVVAVHKVSKRKVIVHKVDHPMMMFRAFYPDERDPKTGNKGRFATRTEWQMCRDWEPEVTLSPVELKRQEMAAEFERAIAQLEPKDLALVEVLCDDANPAKNFAKLIALRAAGFIKGAPEVVAAAVEKGAKK